MVGAFIRRKKQSLKVKMYPNCYMVGAAKAGSTSVYEYFSAHPDIYVPPRKELHYFSAPELLARTKGPGDDQAVAEICSNEDEYLDYYTSVSQSVVADVSPSYLYHFQAASKIKLCSPDSKVIIFLRNPVSKARSQYLHLLRGGREKESFEKGILAEPQRIKEHWNDMWHYIESSRYSRMVSEYLEVFGRAKVKIVLFEDFRESPESTFRDICDFLGIEFYANNQVNSNHNLGRGKNRFGQIGTSMVNSGVARNLFHKVVPRQQSLKVKNFLKKLVFEAAPDCNDDVSDRIIDELVEDIENLERLSGIKTNWLDSTRR